MSTNEVPLTTPGLPQIPADVNKHLRRSLLANVSPMPGVHAIALDKLDADPTNPGSHPYSERYKRREQPIHESYDILGRIVYPLIICTKDDATGRYWLVDGHGRFGEAKKQGQSTIECIVFPPLTISQRILLRQVLNSAQEPIDPPLILRDLQTLAEERHLDIRNNKEDVEELLSAFPASFAKQMKGRLRVLAQWPKDVTDKISIDVNQKDDGEEPGTIGYNKIKDLDVVIKKLRNHHAGALVPYPGEKLNRRLLDLYFEGAFRDGGRSQDGLDRFNKAVLNAEDNEPLVGEFLKGNLKLNDFIAKLEAKEHAKQASESQLVRVCYELKGLLSKVYPPELSDKELFALKSSATVITEVLQAIKESAAAVN